MAAKIQRRIEWSKWFAAPSGSHKAVAGVDFQSTPRAFGIALRMAARRHGLRAVARTDGNTVRFWLEREEL
ncbi:hypothetical protein ACFYUL_23965 [Streptomyces sp. NPDC004311]|uniref:hypothetical protein n=1 Tax=Streptomyces sp. NPDC004311 TaxID=3364698 RepID=UPI0036ABC1EF